MLRNGYRAILACCVSLLPLVATAQPRNGASEERALREQEEDLLRQLTGGDTVQEPQALLSPTKNNLRATTSKSADALSAEIAADPRVEKLIDEQARAALAAIDDVQARGADAKSSKLMEIKEAPLLSDDAKPAAKSPVGQRMQESFVERAEHNETALTKVTSLSKELGARDAELSNLKQDLITAQRKSISAEARASTLAKQVETLRAKLMVTETEVERLSRVIETRNKQVIQSANGGRTAAVGAAGGAAVVARGSNPTVVRERVIVKEGKAAEDLPVVVVTSEKANLRTGPGQDNSSLMAVTKGNRLVVETKQGAWYRVFTPNGVRAWVSADAVQLQRGGGAL